MGTVMMTLLRFVDLQLGMERLKALFVAADSSHVSGKGFA